METFKLVVELALVPAGIYWWIQDIRVAQERAAEWHAAQAMKRANEYIERNKPPVSNLPYR